MSDLLPSHILLYHWTFKSSPCGQSSPPNKVAEGQGDSLEQQQGPCPPIQWYLQMQVTMMSPNHGQTYSRPPHRCRICQHRSFSKAIAEFSVYDFKSFQQFSLTCTKGRWGCTDPSFLMLHPGASRIASRHFTDPVVSTLCLVEWASRILLFSFSWRRV
jgi:hypothetical protein